MEKIELGQVDPFDMHNAVKDMYSWSDVAQRTEKVYASVIMDQRARPKSLMERMVKYNGCGIVSGKISCILVAMDVLFYWILEWLFPRSD